MAETLTANYGWTKPDPGASANTWGATLNATTDKVDAQVWANQQAGLPIGGGCLWFTPTPPTNFLIANGAALATTGTYAGLFAVIGYTYGGSGANFNLPNFANAFPMGASATNAVGATGGEATHLLTAAEMPAHPHAIADVTHNHAVNQTAHNHPDPGHTHPVNDPGHQHSNVITPLTGPNAFGGGPGSNLSPGFTQGAQTGVTIATFGANLQPANANISLNASATGLTTTQNAGGGAAHNTLPPYLCINFIVRYQ